MFQIRRRNSPGLVAVLILALVSLQTTVAQQQHSSGSQIQGRFARAADKTSSEGMHAKLPPHISTLLGISNEQESPVLQNVVRKETLVRGIDVLVANKNDIVLFVVDEAAKDQTLYLTSPSGTLRKVVSVKAGVGTVAPITNKEQKAFEKEKQFWADRLAPASTAK